MEGGVKMHQKRSSVEGKTTFLIGFTRRNFVLAFIPLITH